MVILVEAAHRRPFAGRAKRRQTQQSLHWDVTLSFSALQSLALLRLLAASAGPPALETPKLARRMFRKDQHMQQIAKLLPPLPEP